MGEDYDGPEVTINITFSEDVSVEIVCNTAKEAIAEYIVLEKEFGNG